MGFDCPHCSKSIDGVTTEATLKERVAAKQAEVTAKAGEVTLLKAELVTSKQLAASAEALKAERDTAVRELGDFQTQATRSTSLRGIGVDTATDAGKAVEKSFLALYASDMVGVEEAEKPTFAEWVAKEDGARANPLLGNYFTEGGGAGGAIGDGTVGGKKGLVPGERGVTDPPIIPGKKMTPGQLRAHLQDMEPDEYRAWHAKYGETYGAPALPAKKTADGATA